MVSESAYKTYFAKLTFFSFEIHTYFLVIIGYILLYQHERFLKLQYFLRTFNFLESSSQLIFQAMGLMCLIVNKVPQTGQFKQNCHTGWFYVILEQPEVQDQGISRWFWGLWGESVCWCLLAAEGCLEIFDIHLWCFALDPCLHLHVTLYLQISSFIKTPVIFYWGLLYSSVTSS